jgi:solute carrier family 8 (sodium/calcium exchanger)
MNERIVSFDPGDVEVEKLEELSALMRKELGPNATEEEVAAAVYTKYGPKTSRAQRRVQATRAATGGQKKTQSTKVVPFDDEDKKPVVSIGFEHEHLGVPESASAKVVITRTGDPDVEFTVAYKTRDGVAKAPEDYTAVSGDLVFKPGDLSQTVTIELIDDTSWETDEDFYLDLSNLRCSSLPVGEKIVISQTACQIIIVDDDDPGELCFRDGDELILNEQESATEYKVRVSRNHGCRGTVNVAYYTEDDTAMSGKDYVGIDKNDEGGPFLCFEDKITEGVIPITIMPKGKYESGREETFRLILHTPTSCRLNPEADGGDKTMNILTVKIAPESSGAQKTDRLIQRLGVNWDKAAIGTSNYKEQFSNALMPEEDSSTLDISLHIVSIPWKVLFAFIPPTDYCDGWLCFCIALAMIGVVTMLIGDLAGLLGCTLGVQDSITAITFVALGTSLPDTFASKTAAVQDDTADASIGNVTGSNSVNVFLGLGLPWTIGALYWSFTGQTDEWKKKYPDVASRYADGVNGIEGLFVVKAGSLGFSVTIFTACAVVCVALLMFRRKFCKGELGGTFKGVSSFALVILWCVYIACSAWKAIEEAGPCD